MTDLDDVLARAVARGAAPALVAMVGSDDAITYSGCAGAGVATDSIFWIASCTKLVTAIAALQCVERGLLELDEPVDTVLPGMADYRVLAGFDANDAPLLRAPARRITLRHLLSHTSGLGYDGMDPMLLRARGKAGPPHPTLLASLRGPLKFDPGEGWTYGVGIDWAGLMVEAATGQTLDAWFAAEVFAPLGMRDSGFAVPQSRRASLQRRMPDGFEPLASVVDDREGWEYFPGGAGLFGTAGDYIRLLQALLVGGEGPGGRILGDEMRGLLFAPQTGSHRAGAVASVIPDINAPFDLFPGMATGWSPGGLVNPDPVLGGRSAGSMGWAGIANTYYWVDPAAGLCAVIFAQYMPFADPAMIATLREFETAVYAAQ